MVMAKRFLHVQYDSSGRSGMSMCRILHIVNMSQPHSLPIKVRKCLSMGHVALKNGPNLTGLPIFEYPNSSIL